MISQTNKKSSLTKYLTNRLDEQRERLMSYFENIQIEMIRQFQMQYLELSDSIDEAIASKNRNKFINSFTDD